MSDPSDVLFDPAAAHPVVGEVRAAIARRDWAATRAAIESAPADARCALVRLGGSEKDLEGFLRGVLERDPDDALAGAMLGTHLTDHGWSIRTTALAKDVSREQFRAFHEWLRRAEQVLIEAAARTPAEPAVWAARLTSARGLSLGQAETRRRYDRLRALDPHNYDGQRQFLQTLCPKWGGTLDALHAWAREEMLAAPPGSLQGGLVAEAHFEHLVQLDVAQRDPFLADQRVRNELQEAAHRSIWHPEFRRSIGWVRVASGFAMMFGLLKDERSAASAFALLGNLASEWPWSGTGQDPAVTIRQRRARAYAAAGGA